jgi:multidrug transporter EmrE-like cation transporter
MKSVWIYVVAAMLFYGLGEWSSKLYASTQRYSYAALAMLGYMINALLFLPALTRWNSLAILGTIWNIGYLIITLALGLLVFQERLEPRQVVGLLLGIVAVCLLSK